MDTVKLRRVQYMYWLFQGNELFWARSPAADFWTYSLWRPTLLSLCCCSFLSAKLCYSEVTVLIHCPSTDTSDGRGHNCCIKGRLALPMSMYSLNRALLVLSPSALRSFFLKNSILILFSSTKKKKNNKKTHQKRNNKKPQQTELSKMVTREQNNFCTYKM